LQQPETRRTYDTRKPARRQARGFGRDIPAGFLCYPATQAADITAFKAKVVPVGEDQAPIIEQTNELTRRLNRQIGRTLLPEAQALIPATGLLPGVNGKAKMISASPSATLKVRRMPGTVCPSLPDATVNAGTRASVNW
jgi:tryptophanyl-tRNA synthetase